MPISTPPTTIPDIVVKKYLISDTLVINNAPERQYTGLTYTKKKEITINNLFPASTIRTKFDLRIVVTGVTAYGKIYKNGVALGTERSSVVDTWTTFSEDLAFAQGDLAQVYIKGSTAAATPAAQNLNLYGTKDIVAKEDKLVFTCTSNPSL